jgi:hypothetical protein
MLPKNWRTSLCGVIAAAAQGVAVKFPQYAVICEIMSAAAVGALGFFAKDKEVTGGTVPQTVEAEVRVTVPQVITRLDTPEVANIDPLPPRKRANTWALLLNARPSFAATS